MRLVASLRTYGQPSEQLFPETYTKFPISQNIVTEDKGLKEKTEVHNRRSTGLLLRPSHGTIPAAATTNKNIKISSVESNGKFQKRMGKHRSVSNNKFPSATLN